MKKTRLPVLIVILVCILVFVSCKSDDSRSLIIVLPENYNAEYFYKNYYDNHNLRYLSAADNTTEPDIVVGDVRLYRAIEGVTFEKYIASSRAILNDIGYWVSQNKYCTDDAILDYEVLEAELYLDSFCGFEFSGFTCDDCENDKEEAKTMWGKHTHIETIAKLDAKKFQDHIKNSLAENNCAKNDGYSYRNMSDRIIGKTSNNIGTLCIRVSFKDYENLVWVAPIIADSDNQYGIIHYTYTQGEFTTLTEERIIMLPNEIIDLFPELYNKPDHIE